MTQAMKDMPAWGISLVINLSILAIFHFVVYHRPAELDKTSITSIVDDSAHEEELRFSETAMDQVGTDGDASSLTQSLSAATVVGKEDTPLDEQVEEILNPQIRPLTDSMVIEQQGDISASVDVKGSSEKIERGVEGAMDRIAFEIRSSLRDRKTLVIWLFDASSSLNERRSAIANRFDNVYRQVGEMGSTDALYSVVAAYGSTPQLLTPEPLQDIKELSTTVREKIQEDKSGVENVFGTAKLLLDKYRNWHKHKGPWNKLVFIVTDERGDDAPQYLEEVISLAKRSQTRFFTIGNAAIFGQQKGYVKWTYDDGFVDYLQVDQGPESAFPDGVQLPFIGSQSDWRIKQMSASYGPYALTRLCAETGGMFLITQESRGPKFDAAVMREYSPDYRPVRVQADEVKRNAAKASLVTVAQMTYDDDLPVPDLTFRAYNDNILRTDIGEAQKPVAEIDYKLRRFYEALSAGKEDRDKIRESRWQAAFDLAMGRILAMRVRYFGYNQMLANMKVSPKSFEKEDSNMWRLVPDDDILSGPEMRKAAATAQEYLKRVIDDHPGTPWALLAERELSSKLGWSWHEFSQPIPGSDGVTRASDEEVARLLLAEEERRQMERKKASKPRDKPKL
ncbi:hypothetical protein KOR42_35240 [Thalassoglobus neptunius]|uniref:VWFA domain-containing protein n=1 Tax=Thalassoglobus neptunius TaxID=1938619 RepID=A0A5C5WLH3_9PLAN|nr:vWA domain-containing protein [Thalassoglobus neptunius]TWT51636.1 hypothetical protein KOR42_35240 [Thalassoglobus neptunius]